MDCVWQLIHHDHSPCCRRFKAAQKIQAPVTQGWCMNSKGVQDNYTLLSHFLLKTCLFRLHSQVCLCNLGWNRWNLPSQVYLVWWPEILSYKSNNDPLLLFWNLYFVCKFLVTYVFFSHLELLWSIFRDIPEACTWSTMQEEGQVLSVETVESGHVLVTLRSYASGSTKWRQKLQHFTPSDGWL